MYIPTNNFQFPSHTSIKAQIYLWYVLRFAKYHCVLRTFRICVERNSVATSSLSITIYSHVGSGVNFMSLHDVVLF